MALDRLIREGGEDYASLSRLLGRNAAYVQQFIKRGIPRKLDEEDRRTLARYFGVPQSLLGGPSEPERYSPARAAAMDPGICFLPVIGLRAASASGRIDVVEGDEPRIPFHRTMLREFGRSSDEGLALCRVSGDSMRPALDDGDLVMIDRHDRGDRLRDGVYALVSNGVLAIKRIAMGPTGREVAVRSDNPAYESWKCDNAAMLDVLGRVIWRSHRIR